MIHAGTFSKPYSPGIRVGWGILPPKLVEPLLAQKGNVDFGSPHFNQVLMSTVMEMGLFDRHVAGLRESYREKLDATLAAAEAELKPLGVAVGPADAAGCTSGCGCRSRSIRASRVLCSRGRLPRECSTCPASVAIRRRVVRGGGTCCG